MVSETTLFLVNLESTNVHRVDGNEFLGVRGKSSASQGSAGLFNKNVLTGLVDGSRR